MKIPVKLSVIVPVFNEASTILTLLRQVRDVVIQDVELEIVVVDDGSTDNTIELLSSNPHLYSKLVKLPLNSGKGAAVKAGLQIATGQFVLFQDADLEYHPKEYLKIVEALITYKADCVIGSRVLAPNIVRVHSFWHFLGNRVITQFFNLLHNTTFSDIYSCYLAFRRELINPEELCSTGFEQQAEILSLCVQRGRVFYEVSISYHGRSRAEGKKLKLWDGFFVMWRIVLQRFPFSFKRKEAFAP